jgi:hypothetical protein
MQQTPEKPGFSFAPVNRLATPCSPLPALAALFYALLYAGKQRFRSVLSVFAVEPQRFKLLMAQPGVGPMPVESDR